MAAKDIADFAGGNDKQRAHLNQLVDGVNGHEKRIVKLENAGQNPLNIIAMNLPGTAFLEVQIADALVQGVAVAQLPIFYTSHNGVAACYLIPAVETPDPQGVI